MNLHILREDVQTPHSQHPRSGSDPGLWHCAAAVLPAVPLPWPKMQLGFNARKIGVQKQSLAVDVQGFGEAKCGTLCAVLVSILKDILALETAWCRFTRSDNISQESMKRPRLVYSRNWTCKVTLLKYTRYCKELTEHLLFLQAVDSRSTVSTWWISSSIIIKVQLPYRAVKTKVSSESRSYSIK